MGRGPETTRSTKVKGHATQKMVAEGAVQAEDKHGNDAADVLARRGAAAHAVDDGYIARMRACKRLSEAVQGLMRDIVIARSAASARAA